MTIGLIAIAVVVVAVIVLRTRNARAELVKEGQVAPPFTTTMVTGDNEAPVSLSDFHGKKVILYFYPKDETSGCTKEACAFRDGYSRYTNAGLVVLGCSIDTADAHKEFIQKNNLPFPLLVDPDKKIAKAYGAANGIPILGFDRRITYVIDENGKVLKVYPSVDPSTHAIEILNDLGVADAAPCRRCPRNPAPRPQSRIERIDGVALAHRLVRRKPDADCEHHGRRCEQLRTRLASNHLRQALDMRRDDFRIVGTCDSSRIEHGVDKRICIVVRLGERLAYGDTPELARLYSIEINRRGDSPAKDGDQRPVSRDRFEVLADALCLDEVVHRAVDTINTQRNLGRLERHKFLLTGLFDAFDAERVEPACERSPAMDPAARAFKRNARAAIG